MLANIFLHHVLDKWFEEVVRPRMQGRATLVRFADDFLMTFETYHDAKRVCEQRAWLSAALNGHFAYFGITGNIRRIQEYRHQVERIWHKWLERRTRGRKFLWDKFRAFLARHTLPAARIIHRYTRWNEALA